MTMSSAFQVSNLVARYGQLVAVSDVTVDFSSGEKVGIFGHNGSGKSTLLKSLVGAIEDIDGTVSFDGTPIEAGAVDRNVLLGIGMVPQVSNVFPNLTVEQCLKIAGLRTNSIQFRDVFDLFPILEERKSQRAGSMSGGEQQILAVAMAMMTHPKAILLDEPTAGLSPVAAQTVLDALNVINERTGASLIMVEQNVLAALEIVDRAVVLRAGQIVFDGQSADLRSKDDLWNWF